MRLLVASDFKPAGGIIGAGFEELRWPLPVRPGDELRVECEVLEVRPSKSRPAPGLVKVRTSTLNQDAAPVTIPGVRVGVMRRGETGTTVCGESRCESASRSEGQGELKKKIVYRPVK